MVAQLTFPSTFPNLQIHPVLRKCTLLHRHRVPCPRIPLFRPLNRTRTLAPRGRLVLLHLRRMEFQLSHITHSFPSLTLSLE